MSIGIARCHIGAMAKHSLIFVVSVFPAVEVYLDQTASSEGNGSASSPCSTLSSAVSLINRGDFEKLHLIVSPGVYSMPAALNGSISLFNKTLSITATSNASTATVFDCQDALNCTFFFLKSSRVTVSGITFIRAGGFGVPNDIGSIKSWVDLARNNPDVTRFQQLRGHGAIAMLASSEVRFQQCLFSNTSGAFATSAFYAISSNLSFSDSEFSDVHAVSSLIYTYESYISFLDTNVRNCSIHLEDYDPLPASFQSSTVDGLALIRAEDASSITFSNCNITHCRSSMELIRIRSDFTEIRSSTFAFNTVKMGLVYDQAGGVIKFPTLGGIVSISDSVFANNSFSYWQDQTTPLSIFRGSAVAAATGVNMTNCLFSGNRGNGGTVYLTAPTNSQSSLLLSTLINCTFAENVAPLSEYSFPNSLGGTAIHLDMGAQLILSDCLFESNAAESLGGAISMEQVTTIQATRTRFIANRAAFGGALAVLTALDLTQGDISLMLENCTFDSNHATSSGGAIRMWTRNVSILRNVLFTGNTAAVSGGTIFVPSLADIQFNVIPGVISFENSTFLNNSAPTGGAVRITLPEYTANPAEVIFSGCQFVGNSAVNGGAMSVEGNEIAQSISSIAISDCLFESNQATTSAGALSVSNLCPTFVNNSVFRYNSASSEAGAVSLTASSLNLFSCLFYSNQLTDPQSVGGLGGALSASHLADLYCESSRFELNSAGFGGAISITNAGQIVLTRSNFIQNSALHPPRNSFRSDYVFGGGALSVNVGSNPVLVTDCYFYSNTASEGHGGAIAVAASTLQITKSLIEFNNAGITGGAVSCFSCSLTVNESTLQNINAVSGGGISHSHLQTVQSPSPDLFINNCTFIANVADTAYGGALYMDSQVGVAGSNAYITAGSLFWYNAAIYGGAIAVLKNHKVNVDQAIFRQNKANNPGTLAKNALRPFVQYISDMCAQGGVIWMDSNATAVASDSLFDSNLADGGVGGAVYTKAVSSDRLQFQRCIFKENEANIGAAFFSGAKLRHSIASTSSMYPSAPISTDPNANQFINNQANFYGDLIGSDAIKFVWSPTAESQFAPTMFSGDTLGLSNANGEFRLVTVDSYGQTVTWAEETSDATLETVGVNDQHRSITLVGNTIASVNTDGNITFRAINAIGFPGVYALSVVPGKSFWSLRTNLTRSDPAFIRVAPCVDGQIRVTDGEDFTVCRQCPTNTWSLEGDTVCRPCLNGALCDNGLIWAAPGNFLFELGSGATREILIVPCMPSVCTGSNQCRPHHTGPQCAECEPGYNLIRGICEPCDHPNEVALFAAILLMILFILYVVFILKPSASAMSTMIFFTQALGILIHTGEESFAAADSGFFSFIFAVSNLELRSVCIVSKSFYVQFWIVLTVCPVIISIIYLLCYLSERFLLRPHGALHPFIPHRYRSIFNTDEKRYRYGNAFVVLMNFLYLPICVNVLRPQSCVKVAPDDWRISSDLQLPCSGDSFEFYRIFSIVICVLFVFPAPLYLLALLRYARSNPKADTLRRRLEIITSPYKPSLPYWEVVDQARKPILACVATLASGNLQLFALAVAIIFFLTLHTMARPFRRARDTFSSTVSLLVLTAGGLLLSSNGFNISTQFWVVSLLGYLFLFFALWRTVSSALSRLDTCKSRQKTRAELSVSRFAQSFKNIFIGERAAPGQRATIAIDKADAGIEMDELSQKRILS